MIQRMRYLVRKFLQTRLELGINLAGITVLSILTISGMMTYSIWATHDHQTDALVIDMAGRQRTLIQLYLREVILHSQGISAQVPYFERILIETNDALMAGGPVVVTMGKTQTVDLPAAPTPAIRAKLSEQQRLLAQLTAGAAEFLKVSDRDPAYPARLKQLIAQATLAGVSAYDAVHLFSNHSQSKLRHMIQWQTVVGLTAVLFLILFGYLANKTKNDLETEIQERRRAQWKLTEANLELGRAKDELETRIEERTAELSRSNKDLSTLLYVVSHDLKEPLRAIVNFSSMLSDRISAQLDDKGRDFLRRIIRGAERLRNLLDDILMLSRVRLAGPPEEEIDGELILTEAMGRLDEMIRKTEATIRLDRPIPKLRVDKRWAVEAVYNLIENALKFTRDGLPPDVEIAGFHSVEGNREELGFIVRDRGPGVPVELQNRIFQLFQRGVGQDIEGTGAGLAIVREIAERHGGRAMVRNREGGGSEFIVTFGGSGGAA